jgi:hypothetical protein
MYVYIYIHTLVSLQTLSEQGTSLKRRYLYILKVVYERRYLYILKVVYEEAGLSQSKGLVLTALYV